MADSSVIPERLAPLVEAGIMPEKMVPEWEIPARDLYMEYPQRQSDEAVRTGTFGAAAMIYAARSLGLGSTPMIGSDAEAVHREFGLADERSAGHAVVHRGVAPGNWPQKSRRPVAEVNASTALTQWIVAPTFRAPAPMASHWPCAKS
jgi:nitroreductase